jgi:PAS domain S-box-containing protein
MNAQSTTNTEERIEDREARYTVDQAWFQFTQLLIDPIVEGKEETLLSKTACLIPSLYGNHEEFSQVCASIFTKGNDSRESLSQNFSTKSVCLYSVDIPSPNRDRSSLGTLHVYRLNPMEKTTTLKGCDRCHRDSHDPDEPLLHTVSDSEMSSVSTSSSRSTPTPTMEITPDKTHPGVSNETLMEHDKRFRERLQMMMQLLGQSLTQYRGSGSCLEERYAFYENSPDLHAVLDMVQPSKTTEDLELSIVQINPAWTRVLGWACKDLIGISIRNLVHPEDTSTLNDFVRRHLVGQESESSKTTDNKDDGDVTSNPKLPATKNYVEHRLRHVDGTYRWICWSVTTYCNAPPTTMEWENSNRLLVIGRDVTKRKKTEMYLWESRKRLQESQDIAHLGQWELDLVDNELLWSGKCAAKRLYAR